MHTSDYVNHTTWLKCLHARVIPSPCHPWSAVDCFSLFPRFVSLRVSLYLLPLLFPLPLALWPELLLPRGHRQGNHSLRLRQPRSLALWQDTLLPQKHHLTGIQMMMIDKLDRCEREKDFKSTTQLLAGLRRKRGRQNVYIPKNERARQRPFDEAWRADLEWHSPNWKTHWSQTSSSSSSQQRWQHEHQDTQWRDQNWWEEWWQQTLSKPHRILVHRFRVQTIANVVHANGCQNRTLRPTHMFLSVAHLWPSHAPACGSRAWRLKFGMCCTFAHLNSHPLTTCFIDHSLMCLTHFLWTGHPLTTHVCAVQSVHKRGKHRTRLAQELHNIFVRPKKNLSSGRHMSRPLLLSHLPFTTSTSSSSFTLPSTTTPKHALQSGPHDLLQEHPVRHAQIHALPVDKLRHQESLWRENLQSGGNPRTTPTFLSFSSTPPPSTPTALPACDWNQEIPVRHSARRVAVWPSGRTYSSQRLWVQGACNCLEDRRLSWRSISIIKFTG